MKFVKLLRLLAYISEDTAIDIENVTIHGIGGFGGEEDSGTCEFLRIEPTASRSLGADEAIKGMTTAIWLTLAQRSCLRSSNITRANAIALDVVLAVL